MTKKLYEGLLDFFKTNKNEDKDSNSDVISDFVNMINDEAEDNSIHAFLDALRKYGLGDQSLNKVLLNSIQNPNNIEIFKNEIVNKLYNSALKAGVKFNPKNTPENIHNKIEAISDKENHLYSFSKNLIDYLNELYFRFNPDNKKKKFSMNDVKKICEDFLSTASDNYIDSLKRTISSNLDSYFSSTKGQRIVDNIAQKSESNQQEILDDWTNIYRITKKTEGMDTDKIEANIKNILNKPENVEKIVNNYLKTMDEINEYKEKLLSYLNLSLDDTIEKYNATSDKLDKENIVQNGRTSLINILFQFKNHMADKHLPKKYTKKMIMDVVDTLDSNKFLQKVSDVQISDIFDYDSNDAKYDKIYTNFFNSQTISKEILNIINRIVEAEWKIYKNTHNETEQNSENFKKARSLEYIKKVKNGEYDYNDLVNAYNEYRDDKETVMKGDFETAVKMKFDSAFNINIENESLITIQELNDILYQIFDEYFNKINDEILRTHLFYRLYDMCKVYAERANTTNRNIIKNKHMKPTRYQLIFVKDSGDRRNIEFAESNNRIEMIQPAKSQKY